MGRLAKAIGIAAFVVVEFAVLLGSYIVASVRSTLAAAAPWPSGAAEWATLAIFAAVMTVPAALIGLGVAMIVVGVQRGIAALRR